MSPASSVTTHRLRGDARARHHLVTARVENKAGVLVRVAGLFARRGYNIISLAVAPTDDDRFSRISIVVDVESAPLQQVLDQLDKLIHVVEITELRPDAAREAELLLATVETDAASAARLDALVAAAGASVVERGETAVMVMLAATPLALDDFEEGLARFGIIDLQRTGTVALRKLSPAD
jgi:acetolactate synthase-1/3 small subunit